MTYTDIATVQARLMNSNLGASGGFIVNDTQLTSLITQADDMINFELDITTNTASFAGILKTIATDIISMAILRGRHYKDNNEVDAVDRFWTITPEFTNAHLRKLRLMRKRLRNRTTEVRSMISGRVVP